MKKVTLQNYKKDKYYIKIVTAVAKLLENKDDISTIDILLAMGNLLPKDYEKWLNGQIYCLENIFQGSLSKANRILYIIGFHMHDLNMVKFEKQLRSKRNGKELRLSKRGIKKLDKLYCTNYKWNRSQEIKSKIIEELLIKTQKNAPQKKLILDEI